VNLQDDNSLHQHISTKSEVDYITVELPHSISILLGFCTKLH